MPVSVTRYNVLLSSPGDAVHYCEVADSAIKAINRTHSATTGIELYPVDWRRDSRADSGDEPQALLNKQIVDDADIVLAIFKERFGTPTKGYGSGTEEEIRRALDQGKQVMLYTWQAPEGFKPKDPEQFKAIAALKNSLSSTVMYASFNDTEELRQRVTHDFTKLIFELEGDAKPKKPALSLVCVDEDGGAVSANLLVRKGLAKSKFKPAAFDGRVQSAFKKVAESPVRKPKRTQVERQDEGSRKASDVTKPSSAAVGGLSAQALEAISKVQDQERSIAAAWRNSPAWEAMQPKPVEIEEADRAVVISELGRLGLEADEDTFYLGGLGSIPSLEVGLFGSGRTLTGSDEEKEKYEALESLIGACKERRDYREFLDSFKGIGGIALALSNSGGLPAHHVTVEIDIPKASFVPKEDAPKPSDYFIGHVLDTEENVDWLAEELYVLGESASCHSYESSLVKSESGINMPVMHQPRTFGVMGGERYLDGRDYQETVDWIFGNYHTVEDATDDKVLVRIEFDRVQQGKPYAFPSVLIVKGDLSAPLTYRITADEQEQMTESQLLFADQMTS